MPGVGIHLLTLERMKSTLIIESQNKKTPKELRAKYKEILTILDGNPQFAQLGAMGPDLTFFLGTGRAFVSKLSGIFDFIKKVGGFFGDVSEIAGDLGMTNLEARIRQLGDLNDSLIVTFETGVVFSMVEVVNFFVGNLFGGLGARQEGKSLQEWEWGEILHQYRTGRAARRLLQKAVNSRRDDLHAYALGYITHLATDIAGHPYVNQVTGGQPRAFNARHHLCENFMDAMAWWNLKNQEAANAKFNEKIDVGAGADRVAEMLSSVLKDLTDDSIDSANQQFFLPGNPSKSQIEEAYKTLRDMLKLISDVLYLSPPQPPSIQLPPLPGEPGSWTQRFISLVRRRQDDRDISIWDILLGILVSAALLFVFIGDLVRFIVDIIIGAGTYPLAGAVWYLQMSVYNLYRLLIQFLVMGGVLYPFHDNLNDWIGQQFISSRAPEPHFPHQPPPFEEWNYVLQLVTRVLNVTLVDYHYLSYPNTPTEKPATLSSPYAHEAPTYFIEQAQVNAQYRSIALLADKPTEVDAANEVVRNRMFSNSHYPNGKTEALAFGSAVQIAIDLMTEVLSLDIDYDLDGDRSYGYRSWYEPINHLPNRVVNPKWTI
jgi:hypothetical protein